MTEYKKNTIKQLRGMMTKRGIGYMSGWTKGVLIKRLEEEDKKGIYTPDSQLEQIGMMLESFKIETKDLEREMIDHTTKQKELLEENNALARKKESIKNRLHEIEAHEKFIRMQRQSIEDDLNPDW